MANANNTKSSLNPSNLISSSQNYEKTWGQDKSKTIIYAQYDFAMFPKGSLTHNKLRSNSAQDKKKREITSKTTPFSSHHRNVNIFPRESLSYTNESKEQNNKMSKLRLQKSVTQIQYLRVDEIAGETRTAGIAETFNNRVHLRLHGCSLVH